MMKMYQIVNSIEALSIGALSNPFDNRTIHFCLADEAISRCAKQFETVTLERCCHGINKDMR